MTSGSVWTIAPEVAGVRSPGLESGPPGGQQAFVFVHGNPGSSLDWIELLGTIGEFGRAIALDMPGFGRADKPNDFEYTVDGYARHLAGCLDQLGVEQAHLVLHDFGGPWGLAWAAAHARSFRSAVLINSGIWPAYKWHLYARIWRTPLVGELAMAVVTRRAFEMAVQAHCPRRVPPGYVDRWYREYDRATRRAILKLYRATDPSAVAHVQARALRVLDRPALVIWGKQDPYLPVWLAERQRDAFPSAQIAVLVNSGHFPFADDPGGVRDALLPFVRQQLST
jgi:pimeloyl-ACP methyl ester carboxylesterase